MARRHGLTATDVVDAAATIADRDGPAAVTPSAVAAALGVRTPSLYAHVEGAAGLRHALARRAHEGLAAALGGAGAGDGPPLDRLAAICSAYRAFALEHPGLYQALLPTPRPDRDPELAAVAADIVGIVAAPLADLGVPAEEHVDLVRALRSMLHGFVDLELNGGFGLVDPVDRSFDAAVALVLDAVP